MAFHAVFSSIMRLLTAAIHEHCARWACCTTYSRPHDSTRNAMYARAGSRAKGISQRCSRRAAKEFSGPRERQARLVAFHLSAGGSVESKRNAGTLKGCYRIEEDADVRVGALSRAMTRGANPHPATPAKRGSGSAVSTRFCSSRPVFRGGSPPPIHEN